MLAAPGVEYLPYIQEEFAIVASHDFPERAFDDPEEWESWLCSQPWMSYGLELPIIRRFWRKHFHKCPQMQLAHVLPDLPIILRAIEHGAGISLVPTYMLTDVLQAGNVKILYPTYKVQNDLYMGYLIKNRNEPNLKIWMELLKKPQKG